MVKSVSPDNLIIAHQSTCLFTPALAYVDAYFDGEQFTGSEEYNLERAVERLSPEIFRAEFMGWPQGIPAYFYPRSFTPEVALALSIPHGALPMPTNFFSRKNWEGVKLISTVWKMLNGFNANDFNPYWKKPFSMVSTASFKVSSYENREKAVLVLANYGGEAVKFDLLEHSSLFSYPFLFSEGYDILSGKFLGAGAVLCKPYSLRLIYLKSP